MAWDIASVLGYLHGKDIVCRDLKPDNKEFEADSVLKMFVFGLAKWVRNAGTYHATGSIA